jgi:hypothetical protein
MQDYDAANGSEPAAGWEACRAALQML